MPFVRTFVRTSVDFVDKGLNPVDIILLIPRSPKQSLLPLSKSNLFRTRSEYLFWPYVVTVIPLNPSLIAFRPNLEYLPT